MTGIILQDSKNIPVTCNTKKPLQHNTRPWPSKQCHGAENHIFSVLSLLEKRSFHQDTVIGRVPIFKNSIILSADIKEESRTI